MAEVETSRDGSVLTITLNRPEILNAFDYQMRRYSLQRRADAGADQDREVTGHEPGGAPQLARGVEVLSRGPIRSRRFALAAADPNAPGYERDVPDGTWLDTPY